MEEVVEEEVKADIEMEVEMMVILLTMIVMNLQRLWSSDKVLKYSKEM